MKVLVTELRKGDHLANYDAGMFVERTYSYGHLLGGRGLAIVFNTGGEAYYEPSDVVEVDNRETE